MKNSRAAVALLFIGMATSLLCLTIKAAMVRSIMDNGHLMNDPWFQVTLLDAYLGFIAIYLWVAWRESTLLSRVIWFALIMLLGNMAVAAYVVLQLFRLPRDASLDEIFTRKNAA